ncbi:MAG: DUF3667 domain-containing protein [Bacteroidota bacterium]
MKPSCKNCNRDISLDDNFCRDCGAKVIRNRITLRNLILDIFQNAFGWDNTFFHTIKALITKPHVIFGEYLGGTRKKYMNPFTFLSIGMAVALFIFNAFTEDYIQVSLEFNTKQMEWMGETFGGKFNSSEFQKEQLQESEKSNRFLLKYFNLFTFLLVPFYTLIAFLVYRKPYNYGEHLVLNGYMQGLSFFSSTLLFLISIFTHPLVYFSAPLLLVIYYTYAYGKLYKLTIAQSILKVIVFLAIVFVLLVLIFILAMVAGLIIGALKK